MAPFSRRAGKPQGDNASMPLPHAYDRGVSGGWHRTTVRPGRDAARIVKWARLLADNGLGPEVGSVSDNTFETREERELQGWLVSASEPEVAPMGRRVFALVCSMHGLGICHRDLHLGNLLVDSAQQPLVIDLELACEIDPRWPCYDLGGPSAEVPVPLDHARLASLIPNGVWWDAELPPGMTSMGSVFGSLGEVAGRCRPVPGPGSGGGV
jgi:hypothetical protein